MYYMLSRSCYGASFKKMYTQTTNKCIEVYQTIKKIHSLLCVCLLFYFVHIAILILIWVAVSQYKYAEPKINRFCCCYWRSYRWLLDAIGFCLRIIWISICWFCLYFLWTGTMLECTKLGIYFFQLRYQNFAKLTWHTKYTVHTHAIQEKQQPKNIILFSIEWF